MARRTAAVIVVVVFALAHTAFAQRQLGSGQTPGVRFVPHPQAAPPPPPSQGAPSRSSHQVPPPPPQPPVPNITGGVAQLPPIGGVAQFPMPASSGDVFRSTPRSFAPRYDRRYQRGLDPFGYVSGGYGYVAGDAAGPDRQDGDRRDRASAEVGFLRLNVSPGDAQVYIDGFYVSTVDAFGGTGPARAIEAGPHRVEIRADGYETTTFDVRVTQNEMTTYRRNLDRAEEPRQARNVAPAIPKTFYVIPKCYAGDRKPSADQLPAGCRAASVRAIPPVVNKAR